MAPAANDRLTWFGRDGGGTDIGLAPPDASGDGCWYTAAAVDRKLEEEAGARRTIQQSVDGFDQRIATEHQRVQDLINQLPTVITNDPQAGRQIAAAIVQSAPRIVVDAIVGSPDALA